MITIDTPYFKNWKFIDLFAGLGGFRLAFESLGAECVYSNEWDIPVQDYQIFDLNNWYNLIQNSPKLPYKGTSIIIDYIYINFSIFHIGEAESYI